MKQLSIGRASCLVSPTILVCIVLAMTGCCNQSTRPPYTGPTLPMARVLADINDNNAKIPTLWAHHQYEADVVDDHKVLHHVSGDGTLLYITPDNVRLQGNAPAVGNLFNIGANSRQFWMKLSPSAGDAMWWGTFADLAHVDPDTTGIPIRPDMLLSVLAIATINDKLDNLPAPVMRVDREHWAYVLTWIAPYHNRWVALREVWYDIQTRRPMKILLYDMNGRVAVQADLGAFRQAPVAGKPKDAWPWFAGDYRLSFPDSGSKLALSIDDASLKHAEDYDGQKIDVPQARSFVMPNPEAAGVSRVIRIGQQEQSQ